MKDSKEKEHRISNLKDMMQNISNNKEDALDSFDDEIYDFEESSDDYEIVDAKEMIDTLSKDSNEESEELTIDDEYIYKPSTEDNSAEPLPLEDDDEIDEDYIIKTKFDESKLPKREKEDYSYDNYNDMVFSSAEQEEYINEKFDDMVHKKVGNYSILAILSLVVGILFVIFGVLASLSSNQRIIDNVASGEINSYAAVFILIGILFIIVSIYKLIAIKSPLDNVIDSIKSVDEEKKYNNDDVVIEQKSLANDNKKVKKVGEFDISGFKEKIENSDSDMKGIKHKTEAMPELKTNDNTFKETTSEENKSESEELSEEEKEYEKAKLDSESIDEIFANMKEIEDVPIISIDSKEQE